MGIKEILKSDNISQKKALFLFDKHEAEDKIIFKFNLWSRHLFGKYFTSPDAPFHNDIDRYNLRAYQGKIDSFKDIAFRDGAKTARTKLFTGFVMANDLDHFRKYIKVLAADGTNSKQITTDIYNMFVSRRVSEMYPEMFVKSTIKREETMGTFTTSTGVKIISSTVGVEQRGAIQEEARPDYIWFEDFENRTTIRSAVKTKTIGDNMEEARTGLSKGGACVYTCNYISEAGNVHKLVQKEDERNIVLITPIINKEGVIAWDRYTKEDIEQMKANDDDYEGERLCEPSAGRDVYFDRTILKEMTPTEPIRESAGFKIFREYNPAHRFGSGNDIAKGVGLDSCAAVHIDFETVPAKVVGTFANNLIKPEAFGDEIFREQEIFPGIAGIENNFGTEAILRMKQLGGNMYTTEKDDKKIVDQKNTEYGWNTNQLTKPKMMAGLLKAVTDGLLDLSDKALIAEAMSYTRHDLLEYVRDPRLTTRHFDLLISCAIAWQMKDFAYVVEEDDSDYNIYNNDNE